MKVQLVSTRPDHGFAFNEGIYWPMGLLMIGSEILREAADVEVEILDEGIMGRGEVLARLGADLVGIQANSSLTYRSGLELAAAAAERGAFTVLGGQFASEVPVEILERRRFVDCVVEGPGEKPVAELLRCLRMKSRFEKEVRGVWRRVAGGVKRGGRCRSFDYEAVRPLSYDLVPVWKYHENYKSIVGRGFDGVFQIFTHFGCRYRDARRQGGADWCSYCALGSGLHVRKPRDIVEEVGETIRATGVPKGSKLMLKCYGDNASAVGYHLEALAREMKKDSFLGEYDLHWSLYAQSAFVNRRLVKTFKTLGVAEVYIGFDSADDEVQRVNGLGTSRASHLRAASLLQDGGVRIQAGFVLGCRGETEESLGASLEFARSLAKSGMVDVFHASPMVVLPGSPAFSLLCVQEPGLRGVDFLDTDDLQRRWLKHFCPALGSPENAIDRLAEVCSEISLFGEFPSSFGGWRERFELRRQAGDVGLKVPGRISSSPTTTE